MSLATTSAATQSELTFYVKEKSDADEFTFYLDQRDDSVVRKLEEKLKRRRRAKVAVTDPAVIEPAVTDRDGKEQFSFAERIQVINLYLTKKDLNWSKALAKAFTIDPLYRLLADLIKTKKQEWQPLEPRDPKAYRKELATNLNEIIEQEDLEKVPWPKPDLKDKAGFLETFQGDETTQKQWRNRLILERTFPGLIKDALPQQGRGLICYSYVGRYLSVTFRKMRDDLGYKADDFTEENKSERRNDLFSLWEYCQLLFTEIFSKTGSAEHAHGLVVITGATKSAKSEIARGLIELYLEQKSEKETTKRHHLITFEDPVERFYVYKSVNGSSPWTAVELMGTAAGRDYTPRQKENDARLLQEALNDALRQTPALFFVGETRNREEWKVLLDFAATGHLIVTTAHAGSLVEAMHKIFEALNVKTAADRSEIANKLLGVVHLRRHQLEFTDGTEQARTNVLFPALWRRTARGIAALTSDGLASLLPYRPKTTINVTKELKANGSSTVSGAIKTGQKDGNGQGTEKERYADAASCLGRRWIIEELVRREPTSTQIGKVFEAVNDLKPKAYEKAIEWDLEGV